MSQMPFPRWRDPTGFQSTEGQSSNPNHGPDEEFWTVCSHKFDFSVMQVL